MHSIVGFGAASCLAAVLAAGVAPTPARAQEGPILAGIYGTGLTSVGGLAPTVSPATADADRPTLGVAFRYGHFGWQGHDNSNNYGATFTIPFGGNRLSVTAGYAVPDCGLRFQCHGFLLSGAEFTRNLLRVPVAGNAGILRLDASAEFGFSALPNENILSEAPLHLTAYGVSLPLGLTIPSGGMRVIPFLSPALALGRYRDARSGDSGASILLRGGIGVADLLPGATISVGFSRYQSPLANAVVGIALSWSTRP